MQPSRSISLLIGAAVAPFLTGALVKADDKELPRNLEKGSTIIGQKVANEQGQNLGEVQDIVIDPQTGQIAYAVLSFGGFLGIGDKYFAIPWQSLHQGKKGDNLVLNVEKERLKSAPGFDKNHWPDLNPQWAAQINEFYGVPVGGAGATGIRIAGFDFGEQGLKREATTLPLRFETGKSYHYVMEMKPYMQRGGFSSPQGERNDDRSGATPGTAQGCKHDNWLKVIQSSGDEATVSFTFDATNCEMCKQAAKQAGREAPGKGTYTVRTSKRGEVVSVEPEAGTTATKQLTNMEEIVKLQVRQLLGDGLHDQKLEPGRTYDAQWMHFEAWDKAKQAAFGATSGSRESTGHAAKSCALRYDGTTETTGERVAVFTVVPSGAGGSFSNPRPDETPRNEQQAGRRERDDFRQVGGMTDHPAGMTNFRLTDGFLERFALILPASFMNSSDKEGRSGQTYDGPFQLTIRRAD